MVEDLSPFRPSEVVRRLEALIGREHVSEDYVRFRIGLLKAQLSIRNALSRSAACGGSKPQTSDPAPLLDASDVPFDAALLGRLLEGLLAALARGDQPNEDLARLSAAAGKDPGLLERLARAAAFGPDQQCLASLSGRLEIPPDALVFFGRVLAAPFVTETVRRLKSRRAEEPKPSGHCPWCGSPPGLAVLKREEGREGKRVLFCSLCGERWQFARLECPFCGSQQELRVLSVGAADPCSIEACDKCKGYLKTVDERKLPEHETVVPLAAATATLHLDLVAEREGCARQVPYVALH